MGAIQNELLCLGSERRGKVDRREVGLRYARPSIRRVAGELRIMSTV